MTSCPCFTCQDHPELGLQNPTARRMIVCPTCGNKRCPRATHHDQACTGSNEPGQIGSRYALVSSDPTREPDVSPSSPPPPPADFLPLTLDDGAVAKSFGLRGPFYTFLSLQPTGNRPVLAVRASGTIPLRFLSRSCFCGLLGSPNLFWSRDDQNPRAPDLLSIVDTLEDLFCGRTIRLKGGLRAFAPNRFFLAIDGKGLPPLQIEAGFGPFGPDRLPTLTR